MWEAPNLLTQKLPGERFGATTTLSLSPRSIGESAGLIVYGYNYGWIGLENGPAGIRIVQVTRLAANQGGGEVRAVAAGIKVTGNVRFRVRLEPVTVSEPTPDFADYWPSMLGSTHARVIFSYSIDGKTFVTLGSTMQTLPGRWVGTQIGLFAQAPGGTPSNVSTRIGWADFADFRVTP